MSTMRTALRTVLGRKVKHQGPFSIKTLASGQRRYYVLAYANGRQRTVAICDSEAEAQEAYRAFKVTRAWQNFPPVSPAQRERLSYYARTVPAIQTALERIVTTFVHPIPLPSHRRGQQRRNRKTGATQ